MRCFSLRGRLESWGEGEGYKMTGLNNRIKLARACIAGIYRMKRQPVENSSACWKKTAMSFWRELLRHRRLTQAFLPRQALRIHCFHISLLSLGHSHARSGAETLGLVSSLGNCLQEQHSDIRVETQRLGAAASGVFVAGAALVEFGSGLLFGCFDFESLINFSTSDWAGQHESSGYDKR